MNSVFTLFILKGINSPPPSAGSTLAVIGTSLLVALSFVGLIIAWYVIRDLMSQLRRK